MICPACKSGTIVVERSRIELDYCPSCEGVWFDSGELELLLASLGTAGIPEYVSGIFRNVETRSGERKRKCPVCHRTMPKSHVGEQPRVLIDACRDGHGLWFDGGELDQVLKQLARTSTEGHGPAAGIEAFLGETLQARRRGDT